MDGRLLVQLDDGDNCLAVRRISGEASLMTGGFDPGVLAFAERDRSRRGGPSPCDVHGGDRPSALNWYDPLEPGIFMPVPDTAALFDVEEDGGWRRA